MTAYQVRISPEAQAGFSMLPPRVAAAAMNFISVRLRQDPQRVGVELRGSLKGRFMARRGQYRIVYAVDVPAGAIDILQILARH